MAVSAGQTVPNILDEDFSLLQINHSGDHDHRHIEEYSNGKQFPHGLHQEYQKYPKQQKTLVSYGHQNQTLNQSSTNVCFTKTNSSHQHSDSQHNLKTNIQTQNPYTMSQTAHNNSIQHLYGVPMNQYPSQSTSQLFPGQYEYQHQHQHQYQHQYQHQNQNQNQHQYQHQFPNVPQTRQQAQLRPQPQPQPKNGISLTLQNDNRHQSQLLPHTGTSASQALQQPWIQPNYLITLEKEQEEAPLQTSSTLSSVTVSQAITKLASEMEQLNYPWCVNDDMSSLDSTLQSKEEKVGKTTSPSMTATASTNSSEDDSNKISSGIQKSTSSRELSPISHESPVNKANFAPPPSHPLTTIPKTKLPYLQGSDSAKRNSLGCPDFSRITHSGHLSARLSAKSLILKRWRRIFWISYGENEIIIFRSRADFDEWATNPYLTKEARDEIVKTRINFEKGSVKNIGVKCFRASKIRPKDYGKSGNMFMFKLEQLMHHGPVLIGAFASSSKTEIASFSIICNAMIDKNEYGLRHFVSEGRDDVADSLLLNFCSRDHS